MPRERRKHRRVQDRNIVMITLVGVPGRKDLEGRTMTCTTADISIGGVRLLSNVHIPVGTILELRVAAVSPPKAFRHIGRVSWHLEVLSPPAHFVGVEFTGTDDTTKAAWHKFVQDKIPAPLTVVEE